MRWDDISIYHIPGGNFHLKIEYSSFNLMTRSTDDVDGTRVMSGKEERGVGCLVFILCSNVDEFVADPPMDILPSIHG